MNATSTGASAVAPSAPVAGREAKARCLPLSHIKIWIDVDAAIKDEAERLGGTKLARWDEEWRDRAVKSLIDHSEAGQ